jgi:hypothetical protein
LGGTFNPPSPPCRPSGGRCHRPPSVCSATLAALVLANSPLAPQYEALLQAVGQISIGVVGRRAAIPNSSPKWGCS